MNHGKQEEEDEELTLKPDCTRSAYSKPPTIVKSKQRMFKGQPYGGTKTNPGSSRHSLQKKSEEKLADAQSDGDSEFEWGKFYD